MEKVVNRLKNFSTFLALNIAMIFLHGLMMKFFPEHRTLKIILMILNFLLISISIIIRTPNHRIISYSIVNGLIFFIAFELSNFFTYLLVGGSKYLEHPSFMLSLGLVFFIIFMGLLISIGLFIKPNKIKN